jgi:hypothetical protein
MITLLMIGGAVVAGGIVALLGARHRSGQEVDLGAVSNQWVAEHRLGQTHDTQR